MEQSTRLVHTGELQKVVGELLAKELAIVDCISKILPQVTVLEIKKDLQKKLDTAFAHIAPLQAGYIPVDNVWFDNVETKSKWRKKMVEQAVKTMPKEVHEAWDRAKELGIFETYGVTGSRGGDPILMGRAKGSKTTFFIASWLPLRGGYSVGVRYCPQNKE